MRGRLFGGNGSESGWGLGRGKGRTGYVGTGYAESWWHCVGCGVMEADETWMERGGEGEGGGRGRKMKHERGR